MNQLPTLSPGIYRRERAYQNHLELLQGVVWQQGTSPLSGEISISSAVAVHRAQRHWVEQQNQPIERFSATSPVITIPALTLAHPELDTLHSQYLWFASLPTFIGSIVESTPDVSGTQHAVAVTPDRETKVVASVSDSPARHGTFMTLWILAFDAYAQLHNALTKAIEQTAQTPISLLQVVVGSSLEWKHAQERFLRHKVWLQQRRAKRIERLWQRFTYTQRLALNTQQAALTRSIRIQQEYTAQNLQHLTQSLTAQEQAILFSLRSQQERVVHRTAQAASFVRAQYEALSQLPNKLINASVTTRQNLEAAAQNIWEWSEPGIAALSHVASVLSLSIAVALFLLFASPIVILEGQGALQRAQAQWWPGSKPQVQVVQENPAPSTQPSITSAEDLFSITIPDLGIKSTITANVDATNTSQYESALKTGIAHAQGSALPDEFRENKTMYLFAHSTNAAWNIQRYNAQFYALKDAELGSTVTIRFWGQDYTYVITDRLIVEADDTSYLAPQTEESRLVLQTCYPPGSVEKRLIVIAKPQ